MTGPLTVGVGLGSTATEPSNEFDVFEVFFSARGTLTDEYIRVMKSIWTQPLASHDGPTLHFIDTEIFPRPIQLPHPPIWVGGWTDKPAERTGRLAEGWIPGWLSPAEMARGRNVLRKSAASSKTYERDVDDIQFALDGHIFGSMDDVMTLWSETIIPEFQ